MLQMDVTSGALLSMRDSIQPHLCALLSNAFTIKGTAETILDTSVSTVLCSLIVGWFFPSKARTSHGTINTYGIQKHLLEPLAIAAPDDNSYTNQHLMSSRCRGAVTGKCSPSRQVKLTGPTNAHASYSPLPPRPCSYFSRSGSFAGFRGCRSAHLHYFPRRQQFSRQQSLEDDDIRLLKHYSESRDGKRLA